jgi:hypothetical protein
MSAGPKPGGLGGSIVCSSKMIAPFSFRLQGHCRAGAQFDKEYTDRRVSAQRSQEPEPATINEQMKASIMKAVKNLIIMTSPLCKR